ncbi:NDP-sugar pyrophosphorylase family protein [Bradyrhizobium sp. LB7.1]
MTMDKRIIPLIMCGGAGTRLWPASREVRPKQFLPLFGTRSTFQDTLLRVSEASLFDRPIVITNASYRFMVLEQLAEIGIEADVILEPMRRDSGPAIAAGAVFAQNRAGEAIVLALAADHVVQDNAAFVAACREGLIAASAGRIVTFGVKPERPATEYGYISPGEVISGTVHAVARFVEKPDAVKAADYVNSGYLWNSGNFMFPGQRAARRIPQGRRGERGGDLQCRRQCRPRSRLRDAGARGIRRGQGDLGRLCGDGEDRARSGGAGVLRLVRRRLLARGVGIVREGRARQCFARQRRVRR